MTIETNYRDIVVDSSNRNTVPFPCGASRTIRMTDIDGHNMTSWPLEVTVRDRDQTIVQTVSDGSITRDDANATKDRASATIAVPTTPGVYYWAFWRTDTPDALAEGTFVAKLVSAR